MQLIETYSEFSVYEHSSGKGVIIMPKVRRGPNGAIFDTAAQAQATALALLWGSSVRLTHRFKIPATTNN